MNINSRLTEWHPELTAWRRELHAHPQTAFEETFASELIASKLQGWGIETHRGLAKTGVVGVIRGKQPGDARLRSIGLRADIDALDIEELNDVPHRSQNPRQDARLRPRRAHDDAAGSRSVSRRVTQFRRHRQRHLSARRRKRRGRPSHG